jgi:pre-mRNA-splicing factor CWC22
MLNELHGYVFDAAMLSSVVSTGRPQSPAQPPLPSPEYQRPAWDVLRKSVTGTVRGVNIANIKNIDPELFSENLIRWKDQFRRSFERNDKVRTPLFLLLGADSITTASAGWYAARPPPSLPTPSIGGGPPDSCLAAQTPRRRLDRNRGCAGAFLQENSMKANTAVFERFHAVLNESSISHRVQYCRS